MKAGWSGERATAHGRMSAVRSLVQLSRLLARACVTLACVWVTLAASAAQAVEPHPQVGKLPGYPLLRGVVPVLGSSAALAAHEKLVGDAFAAVRARASKGLKGSAEPNSDLVAACAEEAAFLATQDVCYRGGPVLHDPTIHLIFWQGQVEEDISKEPGVELFPHGYIETVERYFVDLAHDSGEITNTFAVDPQYGEEATAGKYTPGEYAMRFDPKVDLTVDNRVFPAHSKSECSDESEDAKGPCLLDSDIREEAQKVAGTSEKGLQDIYVVLTPPGVGGCFDEGSSGQCAYKQYCAYHGDFGGDGVTPGEQTLYADIPFVGEVEGCDFGVHPNSSTDNGADAAIDDMSHEVNETITDPIGSQCETGAKGPSECEHNAWTDAIGQEIADKCLPPESTVLGAYGEPLGEVGGVQTRAFNQLIDDDPYWTQRVWSNEAGLAEGGCVQRMIGASFSVSAGAAATVPMTFEGAASGAPGDPAVYWVWDFEGEQVGTPSSTTPHTYAAPGTHAVGLTAYDAYGNARATVETVTVGAAPAPPPPPVVTSPPPVLVRETPAHHTAAQIATELGLPANGAKLVGNGSISFAGGCPPACTVTMRMYAKLSSVVRKHHSTKLVSIGALGVVTPVVSSSPPNGGRTAPKLLLTLNAVGRKLLRRYRTLSCRLQVTVVGQEGGSWQIVRALTLALR
jgi:hypothetical protein